MRVMEARFLLIGGSEDIYPDEPIFRVFIEEAGGPEDARVVIIPTASSYPTSTAQTYSYLFKTMGVKSVRVLRVLKHEDACDPSKWGEVRDATAIFFTGGNQVRLVRTIYGTPLHSALLERLDDDVIIGGTSAGAMALPELMIPGGEPEYALMLNEIVPEKGLGLLRNFVVDTHVKSRNRLWRVLHVLAMHPTLVGVALSGDTAMLIRGLREGVTIGTDVTVVMRCETQSGSPTLRTEDIFGLRGVSMHVLPPGYRVDFITWSVERVSEWEKYVHR